MKGESGVTQMMQTQEQTLAQMVQNCDKEPIHIPGSIQPHGLLLVLQEPNLTILQVSANTQEHLGIPPKELLGQPISRLLPQDQVDHLKAFLAKQGEDFDVPPLYALSIKSQHDQKLYDGIVHRSAGWLILELEPSEFIEHTTYSSFYYYVKKSLMRLNSASHIEDYCQRAVVEIRKICGFDRVMIYRFDENWNGQVIAEDRAEDVDSYQGLHFPASDIPKQARELYRINSIRLIVDVNYGPVPIIVDAQSPQCQAPLDLSHSVLRSVSPVHIQYLKNMQVGASMSISILKNNQLWGLIACHHRSPHYVPYEVRSACDFLGQLVSLQLSSLQEARDNAYRLHLKSIQSRFVEQMSREVHFIDGLLKYSPNLMDFLRATGAVVFHDGKISRLGRVPKESDLLRLFEWLQLKIQDDLFATHTLAEIFPEAQQYKEIASGVLALAFGPRRSSLVVWFRPEKIHTVNWAGNPTKQTFVSASGEMVLSPRNSFESWKETVRLQAERWDTCELEAAKELRGAIIDVVLRKAEELSLLNAELERSNFELDSFAYIASHDLKEPLRGIHNYAQFLLEDYSAKLDDEGRNRLETMARLTQRMEELINSLLYYSRVGRVGMSKEAADLDQVLHETLDILSLRLEMANVKVSVPRPLPTLVCDRVRTGEIFNNLIVNAVKYNDKADKRIEVGYFVQQPDEAPQGDAAEAPRYVFYVKDNGIGIRDKHFDAVFRIFKRLHGREHFGGGTGIGLTIVKKIIERHGGRIWVESVFGEGTTFFFTLQPGA
jgi:light-regulated signal transduction histidine kinase (bacteriophytochrome)